MERVSLRFNLTGRVTTVALGCFFLFGCGKENASAKAPPAALVPQEKQLPEKKQPEKNPSEKKVVAEKPRPQRPAEKMPVRNLGELVAKAEEQPREKTVDPLRFSPPEVNEAKCAARGIRKLEGKHLTLYTDLPVQAAVDELPLVFDAAVPQWSAYFEIPPERVEKWHMVAALAREKEKFFDTGLWPRDLPEFLHGYMQNGQFWCLEQPSDYYRRHLVLHEGTHGFMLAVCGALGPPWYAEGTAELLGTHAWDGKKLTLGIVPSSREASQLWGRIKIIKDDFARNAGLGLPEVMNYAPNAHLKTEPYAWSWAAAIFCDQDAELRGPFRALRNSVDESIPAFALQFWNRAKPPSAEVQEQWQWFVASIEYGYDFQREKIVRKKSEPLPAHEVEFSLATDHGWQSSGSQLSAGKTYVISATGRFQVARTTKPWLSEADGITLRYHRGQPLGKLLAAVSDEGRTASMALSPLVHPHAIGSQGEIKCEQPGVLYFRINDSPAELADNEGTLSIRVREK